MTIAHTIELYGVLAMECLLELRMAELKPLMKEVRERMNEVERLNQKIIERRELQ